MDERERDYKLCAPRITKKKIIIPLPLFFLTTNNNKIVKFIFF